MNLVVMFAVTAVILFCSNVHKALLWAVGISYIGDFHIHYLFISKRPFSFYDVLIFFIFYRHGFARCFSKAYSNEAAFSRKIGIVCVYDHALARHMSP